MVGLANVLFRVSGYRRGVGPRKCYIRLCRDINLFLSLSMIFARLVGVCLAVRRLLFLVGFVFPLRLRRFPDVVVANTFL